MRKIIIFGFPHSGTTILRALLGRIDQVTALVDETDTISGQYETRYVVCKDPCAQHKFFTSEYDDYIKIFLIRNPVYIYSSLNTRGVLDDPQGYYLHKPEYYFQVAEWFQHYSNHPLPNMYTLKYEDMFEENYRNLRAILNDIGLQYDDSIFDHTQHQDISHTMIENIPSDKPAEKDHVHYRTYQINQPFVNNNDLSKINLTPEQREKITGNKIVMALYPEISDLLPKEPLAPCNILIIAYDLNNSQYPYGPRMTEIAQALEQSGNNHIKMVNYKIGLGPASTCFQASKPHIIMTQQFANEHGRMLSERLHIPHVCLLHGNLGEMTYCYQEQVPHYILTWHNGNLATEAKNKRIPASNYDGELSDSFLRWLTCKVSVCIPCHGQHIQYLPGLFENLSQFDTLPHEVSVSVSLSPEISLDQVSSIFNHIKQEYQHLHPRLHLSLHPLTAAQNRNLAAQDTNGNILLFLDADDSYHSQMVSVIQSVWSSHHPIALYWLFRTVETESNETFDTIDVNHLPVVSGNEPYRLYKFDTLSEFPHDQWNMGLDIHVNGHSAMARSIWETMPYPDVTYGEDTLYHRLLTWHYKERCMRVDECLTLYHAYRSAH